MKRKRLVERAHVDPPALSMLVFYINRAGGNLPAARAEAARYRERGAGSIARVPPTDLPQRIRLPTCPSAGGSGIAAACWLDSRFTIRTGGKAKVN
jgi:hypothetical protein